ncbi:ferrous iron transport protein B, partial [Escherichia coli]|nr:ferrous iron transport protein B [Escherichia coli]
HLNIQNLAKKLRIPILPVVARSGKGTDDILTTLSEKHVAPAIPLVLPYGEPAEKAIAEIQALTKDIIPAKQSRWLA